MKKTRIGKTVGTLALALATLVLGAACAPAAPLVLDVRSENRTVLIPGPGDGTIQIQVVAPDAPVIYTDRPRLNLALVIDRSGSMSEARKLDFVKTAAHQLVDMMGPDDTLSIVAYDHLVQVPWPSRRVGRDRSDLHRIIAGLYPGGATFLSGGLEEGFRQARAGQRRGALNRVLLLSDGLANRGTTSRGELRERAAVMSEKGISVSTFGVGNDFDEELMTMVAGGGGGNYRYLGDPERIVAALASEFRTASRTAASEVEIIIRLRRDCRFGSVLGRDWRRDGDAYVIRLGDLSAGERRTVFASLNVAGDRPGLREVGEVAMRYRDPVTSRVITASPQAVSLELVRDERSYREGFDRSVQEKKAVAESSVLVQEAARLADQGKKEEAKEVLGKAAKGLSAAPASPAVRAEMEHANRYKDSLDAMGDMSSEPAKAAQKAIKYRAYETLQQR
ncbi:MAG: VWA domain-containing protein [Deltaproteobacteria bacterium]|nr:VWA domain-containing protein [Deltaproteobacteria bacterium]